MANCKYCGQWAGIFFSEHSLCREAIEAGLPLPPDRRPKATATSNEMTVSTISKQSEGAVTDVESPTKSSPEPSTFFGLSEQEKRELAGLAAALASIAKNHPTTVAESIEHWFVSHGWIRAQRSAADKSLPINPELAALSHLDDTVRPSKEMDSFSKTPISKAPPTALQTGKKMSKLGIFWSAMFPLSGVLALLLILAFNGTPLQLLAIWAVFSGICAVALNFSSEK